MVTAPPLTASGHRPRARRATATVVVAGLVASGALALATAPAAEAAAPGTYTVSGAAVQLNQPSDPGLGTLTPTADAADKGMFGPQTAWPIIPVHVSLARNGHLTTWGTPLDRAQQGGTLYDDWDVSAGASRGAHTQTASMNDYNSFCNGPVTLPDGRLLMVGGNSTQMTMTYDPVSHQQGMGANLAYQRWYATSLKLPDDRVLVLGGADYYNTRAYENPNNQNGVATIPEIGTGTGAWSQLRGAQSATAFGAQDNRWWYPRAFNGPNGTVVGTSGDQVWSLSTAGNGSVTKTGTLPFNPKVSGSQVMYAPGKVLVAGGGQPFNEDGTTATNAAAVVDFSTTTPRTTSTQPMANNRNWLNLTVLPTGEVLANGGTRVGTQGGDGNSVRQAEVWNPATGAWRAAATAQRTRTYHSTSILMPSGAVFTGGGGVPGPEDNLNAELYYPAYLFTKGGDGVTRWASRPAITAISGSATHGGTVALTIGDGRGIASASLISVGNVTHGLNTDQRRVPLAVRQNGGTVSATLPTSVDALPPGDYELTVVDGNGVPSAAQILTVRRGAAGSVTVGSATQVQDQGAPAAAPGGTVPLTVDTSVGLEAANYPGYRLRHQNFDVYLQQVGTGSDGLSQADTSFGVRTGLASSDGVSFEAVNWPGYYLAAPAGGGAVGLVKDDGSAAFAGRATFAAVTGSTGQNTSFQVWGDRSLVLRHQNFQLFAQKADTSDLGRADSTFSVRAGLSAAGPVPLAAGRAVGLQAVNYPGYRIQHENFVAYLRQVGPGGTTVQKNGTTWVVRPGLASADGVSFESLDWPGYFLQSPAGGGAVSMARPDGSSTFSARATFAPVAGAAGQGTTFQVWADRSLVLRHAGFQLWSQKVDTSDLGKADSSFTVSTGFSPAARR